MLVKWAQWKRQRINPKVGGGVSDTRVGGGLQRPCDLRWYTLLGRGSSAEVLATCAQMQECWMLPSRMTDKPFRHLHTPTSEEPYSGYLICMQRRQCEQA